MERPKKHGGSFGFHWVAAKVCGGEVAWIECESRENPGALPPFLAWEGVLATDTGDPGMMVGSERDGVLVEEVIKLITE